MSDRTADTCEEVSMPPYRTNITTLEGARKWVWARLLRRGGVAYHARLVALWYWDPSLLDDALRSLRDDGMVGVTSGRWLVREWVGTARLK